MYNLHGWRICNYYYSVASAFNLIFEKFQKQDDDRKVRDVFLTVCFWG